MDNNSINDIFLNENEKIEYLKLLSQNFLNPDDTTYVFFDNIWMTYDEYLKIISSIKNPKTLYKELLEKTLGDYLQKIDMSKLSIEKKN